MKVIIAGGRDYQFTDEDVVWLDRLHQEKKFTEVFSGGAKGADTCGEFWAASNGIPVKRFAPDWIKHGRAAGPIRNREMAKSLDGGGFVILFPGGAGTRSMETIAGELGLLVIYPCGDKGASAGGRHWGI